MKLLLHPALVYANEWGVNWRRITFWNEVARSDPVEENVNVHVEDIHSARLHRQWWAITPGGGAAIVHHVHRSVGHHVGRKNTPQYLPTTKKKSPFLNHLQSLFIHYNAAWISIDDH